MGIHSDWEDPLGFILIGRTLGGFILIVVIVSITRLASAVQIETIVRSSQPIKWVYISVIDVKQNYCAYYFNQ